MFLTHLYRHVMEHYPHLDNGIYHIVDRVMRPLALKQTPKPRSDHGKARHSVSSTSAHHNYGSSSHQGDDDEDDGAYCASTPSLTAHHNYGSASHLWIFDFTFDINSTDHDAMNKQVKPVSKPSHVSFKRGSLKKSGKKGSSVMGMEGMKYEDEESKASDVAKISYEGDKGSVAFSDTQSFDSRSVGNKASNVMSDSSKDGVNVMNVGPMPVPVEDNPLLNPKFSPSSPRILKRGEVLTDGGSSANVKFSFNQVEKWPSLKETRNENDVDVGIRNVDGDMKGNGNNKLRRIPVSIENGKKVGDYGPFQKDLESLQSGITISICEKSYGRASFARVLVEVEADSGLVNEVEVYYKNFGRSMKLKVKYPWKPPLCTHYKVFGHGSDMCSRREITDVEKTQRTWVNGNNKEMIWVMRMMGVIGSSRGGFNSRGRGGLNGRGFGDQRYGRNEGTQYIPVKRSSVTVNSSKENFQNVKINMDVDKVNNGVNDMDKGMMDIDYNNNKKNSKDNVENGLNGGGFSCQRDVINSKKVTNVKDKNKKKANETKIGTENMFSVLTDEVAIEKRIEWEAIKARIDEACEKDRKIIHSNKMVAIESRNKANSMCKSVMMEQGLPENQAYGKIYDKVKISKILELETWSEDKIDFYKNSIGEDAFEEILKQINNDQCMKEDVADDLSGTTQFMAINVVMNGIDADLNQIQDNKRMYVSVVYGENVPKARINLWKNLLEHKVVVGDSPWVMLGDFNIILKIIEHSNGVNTRGDGLQDFVECVEDLEMEDLNMYGMFYTWIQRMRNPEFRILKKLDKIMGNSHFIANFPASFANFMPYLSSNHYPAVLCMPDIAVFKPRSFRFVNFLVDKSEFRKVVEENWNVDIRGYAMFRLVKFLKTEFERVQKCLDNEPLSSLLREEEMIYAQAYKEAISDEEKLRRQKTKVEWLKDGDTNSSYFHNVVRGRASRNMIEVIYDDDGKVYYRNNVACYTLDIEKAVDLSQPVSDLEVKETLFSIDDNKASGPNGYTFKFFKAAWNVVGKDVCSAVAKFFTSVRNDRRFKYHYGCQKLKITSLFFADDLLMLCHGDMVSASILRRGLDEFSMTSGLYPSMSNAFFCNIPPDVKDEIKLVMPFSEGVLPIRLQLIASVLSSMQVYWCSLFLLPLTICDDIDSLLSKFLWSIKDNLGGLSLRDKIKEFVNVKLGNGKTCSVWFDKWHPRGPLSKLIDHMMIYLASFDINCKVIDLIDNNTCHWPINWVGEYNKVLDIPIPVLNNNLEDKVIWCNQKGKEK
ncbi:RNA-directed DNA polymerase, eukaryota, reverse transcriptase zinc-binding domain protein [Tanacetum coccineum]